MNPAFECPSYMPAEEMAKYIENSDVPSFITDERFRVIAKNKQAKAVLKVEDKELVLRLIFPEDYLRFVDMSVGQIIRASFNSVSKNTVTVSRFRDYYLFRLEKDMTNFAQSAIRIKLEAEKRVSEVEELYTRMGRDITKDDNSLVEIREKQLARRLNAQQMLEMVSDSGLRVRESFEPALNANKVCMVANDYLDEFGVYVSCRVTPSPYCCNGVINDYQSAVAAMIAVAAENCDNGLVRLKNVYNDRKYVLCVNFDLATKNNLGSEKIKEKLEFIQCVAESNGWYARFSQTERCYDLFLILPCNDKRVLNLRAPSFGNWLRYLVRMQLVDVEVPKGKRGN
ncbi:MAG: hypothetical protein IJB65_02675 [Clostridia bacterium]|nr:hypothetical protein [Clostridia bacterium]